MNAYTPKKNVRQTNTQGTDSDKLYCKKRKMTFKENKNKNM